MPVSRLRWSRLADLDLQGAFSYLNERNPNAARAFAASILEALRHLQSHPEMGALASDLTPAGRYRHLVCGHYRIIYRIDSDLLVILRIWDSRRNPDHLRPE